MTLPPWYVLVPICVGICALVIGVSALFVATKNYRRKSGLLIRGSFVISSNSECSDKFVTKIILENQKDRGVTIFAVYLKIGHNLYIEVENLEAKPLILKAYETYQNDFGPIQFYEFNSRRFDLNKLLSDHRVKKRLVLSTSDGKYLVPKPIRPWNPVVEFFKNHSTGIIRPITLQHKGHNVGSNIKYIVEFAGEDKSEEIVLLEKHDFRFNRFKNFRITKEALETKESLEAFFHEQMVSGKLSGKNYLVHDLEDWNKRAEPYKEKIEGFYLNWFEYYIMARFSTWARDWKLKKHNKELVRKRPVSKENIKENQS